MWPLIVIAGALIGGALLSSSSDQKEFTITDESNCNNEFLKFDKDLSITPTKNRQLIGVRRVLQKKIKEYFTQKEATTFLGFYIQGSFKHGTTIRKQDDTCDVDLGVYFYNKPSISPVTIQTNIATFLIITLTKEQRKKENVFVFIMQVNSI